MGKHVENQKVFKEFKKINDSINDSINSTLNKQNNNNKNNSNNNKNNNKNNNNNNNNNDADLGNPDNLKFMMEALSNSEALCDELEKRQENRDLLKQYSINKNTIQELKSA